MNSILVFYGRGNKHLFIKNIYVWKFKYNNMRKFEIW